MAWISTSKALFLVQAAHGEHQPTVVRREQRRTRERLGGHVLGEVGHVMRPVLGPALIDQVVADVLGIADQVVAGPVVFQVVIAAQAADMDEPALRARRRRPVHPTHHDVGLETPDRATQPQRRRQIERSAETSLDDLDIALAQGLDPFGIGADHRQLIDPGTLQRRNEPREERLCAPMPSPGHRLKYTHQGINSSKAAAASAHPQRRCVASAASC